MQSLSILTALRKKNLTKHLGQATSSRLHAFIQRNWIILNLKYKDKIHLVLSEQKRSTSCSQYCSKLQGPFSGNELAGFFMGSWL